MVYIKFGIVFELFVYKIYGDSDGAFLCGTEILNSRLNEMDFSLFQKFRFVLSSLGSRELTNDYKPRVDNT